MEGVEVIVVMQVAGEVEAVVVVVEERAGERGNVRCEAELRPVCCWL